MSKLGDRIKEKRTKEDFSLRGLAELLGVSFSTLARIERMPNVTPSEPTVLKLTAWLKGDSCPSLAGYKPPYYFDSLEQELLDMDAVDALAAKARATFI